MKRINSSLLLVAFFCLPFFVADCNGEDSIVVPIQIAPNVVNLDSNGTWVTVHAEIPYAAVADADLTLNGVSVTFTKADDRGELVGKFAIDDVKAILPPGTVTLTLSGLTKTGDTFTGSDTIKVVQVNSKK